MQHEKHHFAKVKQPIKRENSSVSFYFLGFSHAWVCIIIEKHNNLHIKSWNMESTYNNLVLKVSNILSNSVGNGVKYWNQAIVLYFKLQN